MYESTPHIVEASFSGFLKTILIIIGVFVLLRFLGRVMIAKRNLDEEREMLKREKDFARERNQKLRDFGKVSINKGAPKGNVEDVDYEEVK